MKRRLFLFLYYSFAIYLPVSHTRLGRILHVKKIRYLICRRIFKHCGKNVNVEKGAQFGNGFDIEIGDNSGLGVDCIVPNNIVIGENVMMGPNCVILSQNHRFDRVDIPMILQGYQIGGGKSMIDSDVWIGRDVLMTPGRHIKTGSIIGAGCVLTKDFPEYSIVGGNPSKLIRSRLESKKD